MQENGRRLALVIGVDEARNSHLDPLKHAITDAQQVAEVLTAHCHFELFKPPLLGDAATTDAVRMAVLDLAFEATENDFLLLYFSGHGQQMQVEANRDATYLVTTNFSERMVQGDEHSHLSMHWLRDKLLINEKVRHVLILLDCCYSEHIRTPEDHYLEELRQRISYYFEIPGQNEGVRRPGYRAAIAASGYDQAAGEQEGMGRMTRILLSALRGEVDNVIVPDGNITVNRLADYLKEQMPAEQKPAITSSDSGGYECILAQYPERAKKLRMKRVPIVRERPISYILLPHDPKFQERPDEFKKIEDLLFDSHTSTTEATKAARVALVGITGLGGIGKSQLAAEIAHRYKDRYPDGIFWTPMSGDTGNDWQRQFADLAAATDYFPADDDVANPENEIKRARHIGRYLAEHADVLLILDNVDEPDRVLQYFRTLTGMDIQCSILYTSRNASIPRGVNQHIVERLPEDAALRLLLEHRPALIDETLLGRQSDEAKAARAICAYVDYFPLGLAMLREHLHDDNTALVYLNTYLHQHGVLDIPDARHEENKAPLFSTFNLSWQKISNAAAQRLFKLAAYFPEAVAIPLWLLSLAADIEGNNTSLDPLGQARGQLQKWSLIEVLADNQIRLHPLIREFGRRLVEQDEQGKIMRQEAGERLVDAFANINTLEQRALHEGYWRCLEQVQSVLQYAHVLQPANIASLESVERWLAHDSSVLGTGDWWPKRLPGLFYQNLYNHAVEVGIVLPSMETSERWLRQNKRVVVDAEGETSVRELKHPDIVTCVAYSPTGQTIATGCEDGVVRIWKASTGQPLLSLRGHTEAISCLSFSPDDTMIVSGSADATAHVWSITDKEMLHILKGHTKKLFSVDFSPDGKSIVTTSEDGTFRIWDIATGEEVSNIFRRHVLPISAVFSTDGRSIVTCGENNAFIWDVETGVVLQEIMEKVEDIFYLHALKLVRIPQKTIFISSSRRSWRGGHAEVVTRVRDIESKELVTEFVEQDSDTNMGAGLADAAISRDGRYIVVCSGEMLVRLWDVQKRTVVTTLQGHVGNITGVDFSPDGRTVIGGSEDRFAYIWNAAGLDDRNVASSKLSEGKMRSIAFSSDGSTLAAGTDYGHIQVWDVAMRKRIADISGTVSWINSLAFSAKNDSVVFGAMGSLGIINVESGQVKIKIEGVDLFDPMHVLSDPFHVPVDVTEARFSPDGTIVASSQDFRDIQLWNARDGKIIRELHGHESDVSHIIFSCDGKKLITAGYNGTAHIWDMTNYELIAMLKGAVGNVTSVCISDDGAKVALGTVDGTIQIWSLEPKKVLLTLKRRNVATTCAAFSPDRHILVANDRYGYTSFWGIDGRNAGRLLGTYKTFTEVDAVHWQNNRHVLMAGKGSSGYRPVFYDLSLEGDWS